MSESSRNRVTITLGRSGQVVKRGLDVSDSDSGTKRSVRDRLGNNLDANLFRGTQHNHKRLRGDGMSNGIHNGSDVMHFGKDDLRYKLMQKDASRRAQSNNERRLDLREKISNANDSPISRLDSRHRDPTLHDPNILRRIPSARSADDLPQKDQLGNSYSPWTMDNLRRRSPSRIMRSSSHLSLQRNDEEPLRIPINLSLENARSMNYVTTDVHNASSSVSSATYKSSSLLPPASAKPVGTVAGLHPPTSGISHKTLFLGDELQTIDGLLHSLGLGKYSLNFKAEEVDMAALKQMGETDLKELGIPMGPRKKILLAIAPRSRRQL